MVNPRYPMRILYFFCMDNEHVIWLINVRVQPVAFSEKGALKEAAAREIVRGSVVAHRDLKGP